VVLNTNRRTKKGEERDVMINSEHAIEEFRRLRDEKWKRQEMEEAGRLWKESVLYTKKNFRSSS
jgi:hypothetical protein